MICIVLGIIGLVLVGVLLAGLCRVAGESDDALERLVREKRRQEEER